MFKFNPPWSGKPPIGGYNPRVEGYSPASRGNPTKKPWIDFTEEKLAALTEEARTRWSPHFKKGLVEMAVRFAQNWTESYITKSLMWTAIEKLGPEVTAPVVRDIYIRGLEIAGDWIAAMGGK